MKKVGAPKQHQWYKGERIYTNAGKETKWTFIKELPRKHGKRMAMILCDCGTISSTQITDLTIGSSMQCIICRNKQNAQQTNKKTMTQASRAIGMNSVYFTNMKSKYPERFEKIFYLGYGDLAKGWRKEQNMKKRIEFVYDSKRNITQIFVWLGFKIVDKFEEDGELNNYQKKKIRKKIRSKEQNE